MTRYRQAPQNHQRPELHLPRCQLDESSLPQGSFELARHAKLARRGEAQQSTFDL